MSDDTNVTLAEQLKRLRSKSDALKRSVSEVNQKTAYIADTIGTFTDGLTTIINLRSASDDLDSSIGTGLEVGAVLESRLDSLASDVWQLSGAVDQSLPLFATSSSSVVATCNSLALGASTVAFRPCPFLEDSLEAGYARRLGQLNPSLGQTYQSAWNAYFAEPHDPGRTALWEMRQTYDHFFDVLAPDDAVRRSTHWDPKDGHRPDQVHRDERLRYAAYQWVSDPDMRQVLLASVEETTRAYGRLNQAHQRGPIPEKNAREVFLAVDSIIRRWVDMVRPWPPHSLARASVVPSDVMAMPNPGPPDDNDQR